ncbi:MAG: hypothetical protein AUI49_03915 [Candidatus Rokubacteria bacterium 13_1_40CM_2_68_13]|nr:MAG: hypothetical protein AUI49_03915 [Candidatus Rokubacteria bacterium 13_1_40CM_2_68_13]
MALLIWADVVPGLSVAQMNVRFGIPPSTPGFVLDQSMAREGSRMPDQRSCAWATKGVAMSRRAKTSEITA